MTLPYERSRAVMKRAGEIYNGYAGRRADDPMGSEVVGKIIRSLESSGWVCVPREMLERVVGMCGEPTIDRCACGRPTGLGAIVHCVTSAPRLTGERR